MFDMRSTQMRKNPVGAIRAFQSAFDSQSRAASLVVKVVEAGHDTVAMAELTRAVAGWPNITLMTKHLSDDQTLDVIAGADCLVSLHRSEGFGLTIAEAMSVGTPSIITNWSAPTEFSSGAALAVGYRLVPTIDPSGRYGRNQARWAEPDQADAVAGMLRLSTDEGMWTELSQTGMARAAERRGSTLPAAPYKQYFAT
jgi:glycosyltransferase involved in cell wall biosynthesis